MDIKTALSAETCIKNSKEKFERMFGEEIHTQKFPMKKSFVFLIYVSALNAVLMSIAVNSGSSTL